MNSKPFFRAHFKSLKPVAVATTLAFLIGVPCKAQQAREVSVRYAQVALQALHVIEAPLSSDSNVRISTAQAISAAEAVAATGEERRFSAILQQIYELKVHDDSVIAAYQRVIEAENYTDDSDTRQARERKDYAASQLTDTLAAIQNREDRCFRQLETSLNQRSLQNVSICSAWIQ